MDRVADVQNFEAQPSPSNAFKTTETALSVCSRNFPESACRWPKPIAKGYSRGKVRQRKRGRKKRSANCRLTSLVANIRSWVLALLEVIPIEQSYHVAPKLRYPLCGARSTAVLHAARWALVA
jgi:hypothetical protein